MTKNAFLISILAVMLFVIPMKSQNQYDKKLKLAWTEEFDYSGLPDKSKWDYETGYVRNNELQYYTCKNIENARVADGYLIIEAIKKDSSDMKYTSASINTYGKKHFFRGRLEIRAKLPSGRGIWPAIWMLGVDFPEKGWPECGEIDIMEYVGYDTETIYSTVHTPGHIENKTKNPKQGDKGVQSKTRVSDATSEFHIYAMEWTEDCLIFFIDGKKTFTYTRKDRPESYWRFDKEHYLIINLAVGGTWGGLKGIDETIFPAKYYIDWIRYYN